MCIIIIFHNNEDELDHAFKEHISKHQNIKFCLVDNDSKDNTLTLLKTIKEDNPDHISIVEIKKHVTDETAKKAGARYMSNKYDLKHIGCINVNSIKSFKTHLNTLIDWVGSHETSLMEFNQKVIDRGAIKASLYKSIFCVMSYLKQINTTPFKPLL